MACRRPVIRQGNLNMPLAKKYRRGERFFEGSFWYCAQYIVGALKLSIIAHGFPNV